MKLSSLFRILLCIIQTPSISTAAPNLRLAKAILHCLFFPFCSPSYPFSPHPPLSCWRLSFNVWKSLTAHPHLKSGPWAHGTASRLVSFSPKAKTGESSKYEHSWFSLLSFPPGRMLLPPPCSCVSQESTHEGARVPAGLVSLPSTWTHSASQWSVGSLLSVPRTTCFLSIQRLSHLLLGGSELAFFSWRDTPGEAGWGGTPGCLLLIHALFQLHFTLAL